MTPSSLFVFGDPGLDFVVLVFLQIAVVCGLAWCLARGRAPVVRSKVWTGALLACLLGPVLIGGFELSGTSVVALDSPLPRPAELQPVVEQPRAGAPEIAGPQLAAAPEATPAPLAEPAPAPDSHEAAAVVATGPGWSASFIALNVLVGVWLLGVLVGVVRLARSMSLVARLKSSARPLDSQRHAVLLEGVARAFGGKPLPYIAISDDVPQPLTLGGRGRPMVVLPSELLHSLSLPALRDVLVHECAHVLQGDLRLGWLQSLAHVLYWPHPAVHLLNRELSVAREELCDNHVLGQGSATDYARTLVALCERPHLDAGILSCGLLPLRWSMEQRVVGLLDSTRSLRVRMGRGGAATLLAALVGVSGVVGGTRFDHESAGANRDDKVADTLAATTAETPAETTDLPAGAAISVRGRVVGPDAAPVRGVPVYLHHTELKNQATPVARSDAEGRFHFETEDRGTSFLRYAKVVAKKPGLGFGWRPLQEFRREAAEIRLVEDKVIEGRIVNLEGRPVAGVVVQVSNVYSAEPESLDPWLAEIVRDGVGFHATSYALLPREIRFHSDLEFFSGVTDGDGRFALHGIGKERLASLRLSGETVVSQQIHVITRAHASFQANSAPMGPGWGISQIHGHSFEHHAAPTRVVRGIVRDGDSGEPLAGARIRATRFPGGSLVGWVSAVTDAKGGFRLVGLPKGEGSVIRVVPGPEDACFPKDVPVPDPAGVAPFSMDIPLDPGILLRGKVVEEGTKKGVEAYVEYSRSGVAQRPTRIYTDADGSFNVVVTDGPAFLTAGVRRRSEDYKSMGERMDLTEWKKELGGMLAMTMASYHAAARIDVKVGEPPSVELTVARGTKRILRFFDPDGAALTQVRVGYANAGGRPAPTPEDHWVLSAASPGRTYGMIFQHRARGLAAFLELDKSMPETTDITLVPWARLEGRLVDEDGKPRAGVRLDLTARAGTGHFSNSQASPAALHTDAKGRFVVEGLVPELRYTLQVQEKNPFQAMARPAEGIFEGTVETSQTKKLGDVVARARR